MASPLYELLDSGPYGEPPGKCIYCGCTGELTDEHIIAFSLGGNAYLPKSSCIECQKPTSSLERYSGKRIFGPLRVALAIQSRRKKIVLSKVEVRLSSEEFGERTESIPGEDLPFVVFPIFDGPAGITRPPFPRELRVVGQYNYRADDVILATIGRYCRPGEKGLQFNLEQELKGDLFARVLAKIAHVLAIARFGVDSFEPYLPEVILGSADDKLGYLIGTTIPQGPIETHEKGVRVRLQHHQVMYLMKAETGPTLLCAEICLFPLTGAPTYQIVIGAAGQKIVEELMCPSNAASVE